MSINPINTATSETLPLTTTRLMPALLTALVGVVLLFAAGFAQTHVLHNAAHDSRHSAVFPCH